MKREGNLFSELVSMENLCLAHKNARKGKRHYKDIQIIDSNPVFYLSKLRQKIINGDFTTSEYTSKTIYEPKERLIYKLQYDPDRLLHHLLMLLMQDPWDNMFIFDLYSAVPGKGLHAGSYRLRKFLRNVNKTKYCLKFDVTKFYPSINPEILYGIIKRTIKDPFVLDLLADIIFSAPGGMGIPIGNYLSQYFSNLYLTPFDHWLKENKRMKYYIRYCDDGVILHEDKRQLKSLKEDIEGYFGEIELKLNPKTSIFEVDKCGVDFLGYKSYRTHTLLRKSSARRLKKRIRYIEEEYLSMSPDQILGTLGSYSGWIKHCNCYNFGKKYLHNNPKIRIAVKHAVKVGGMKWPKWLVA